MRQYIILCLAALALAAQAVPRNATPVVGKITEATVYRGQALVTRDITTTVAAGDQEIVVTGLPETVVPTSLYATAGPNITIRSVRYQVTALRASPNAQVRELQGRITRYQTELRSIETDISVLVGRSAYLDKLENTTAPANGKGATAPSTVASNTKFMFAQRQEIARKSLEMEMRRDNLSSEVSYWQRRLGELRYGRAKSQREAVIYLGAGHAGMHHFTLSYLVNNVNWTPTYSAYLNTERNNIMIEYVAVVTQKSGEDWSNVKLTISTTRPTLIADASALSPLWINMTPGDEETAQGSSVNTVDMYNESRIATQTELTGNDYTLYLNQRNQPVEAQKGPVGQVSQSTGMHQNVVAARMQNLELSAPDEIVEAARKTEAPISEVLAVSYPLPAKFYYTAAPVLADCVYQSIDATNSSKFALLPGPYTAYLNKQFAGRGQLPLVARGQNFTVGFGADTQLRVARELTSKTTEINGGNKLMTLEYTLKLLNFTAKPVDVRVWDRIPRTPDENVMINLVSTTPELSTNAAYLADDRPRGMLRWDVTIPAGAAGVNALKLNYIFTMEYDKSYVFTDLPPELIQLMREEYQDTRERRKK